MWKGSLINVTVPDHYQQIKNVHIAAKLGQLHDVQAFVSADSKLAHAQDDHCNTPLYYSCLYGHGHVAEYLLRMGAKDDKFARCYVNSLVCFIFYIKNLC